jgi:hypothetical protein
MLAVPSMFVDVTVIKHPPAGVGTENECEVGEWRGKVISALGKSDVIGEIGDEVEGPVLEHVPGRA